MSLLSEKLGKYQEPQYYKAKGVYPYFSPGHRSHDER